MTRFTTAPARTLRPYCSIGKRVIERPGCIGAAIVRTAIRAGFAVLLLLPAASRGQGVAAAEASPQEMIAEQMRSQPAKLYEFNRATLRDVLRFLAGDAGISFVAVPEVGVDEGALITFTLRASPFRALEIIAKANGVALFFEEGVWYLRPYNDRELVGRTYKIQYNAQEQVEYRVGGGSGGGTGYGGGSSSTGGIGGGGSMPELGISLQSAPDVFKPSPNPLIKDIKALLGLPTDGLVATIAPDATVDASTPLELSPTRVQPASPSGVAPAAEKGDNGAQVIWNSDSNTLYVVATRQQHQWVEGYLASVDRPQNLFAIEVKFFESTKDPRKQIGLDWSGTLAEGYGATLSNLTASTSGSINVDRSDVDTRRSGLLPPGESPENSSLDTKTYTVTAATPYSAVLSAQDVQVRLRAFLNDRDTTTVSYPRVLTLNNREVVIRSVVNQPVLASSSSVTPGLGGTTTANVEYLPIGTIINILPKALSGDKIVLHVSVTISSIIGEQVIEGNSYPIATSRVYTAALQVRSGYTLAIGGLEEAFDNLVRNGIPLLKDIPVLGELFKSRDRSRSRKNLMIFITPTMLSPRTTVGVTERPQSVIPVSPNDPTPPVFSTEGKLAGGVAAMDNAVRWLAHEQKFYAQVVKENRTDSHTITDIQNLIGTSGVLLAQIERFKTSYPRSTASLEASAVRVDQIAVDLQTLLKKAKKDLLGY